MQDKLGPGFLRVPRRRLPRVSGTARQLVSRAEYITLERDSPIRHEWVGGVLFAMTGTSGVHNRIAVRLTARLLPVAESHGCRTYASDMRLMTPNAGYYPDVMVACDDQADPYFETTPCLLVEVLSPSTRDGTSARSVPPTSPSSR